MKSIRKLIIGKDVQSIQFKPFKAFYNQVKINRKRWGLIYRGEIEPTVSEAKAIAAFFNFDITELIN